MVYRIPGKSGRGDEEEMRSVSFLLAVDEALERLTQLQYQEPHDRRRLFFYRHEHPTIPQSGRCRIEETFN